MHLTLTSTLGRAKHTIYGGLRRSIRAWSFLPPAAFVAMAAITSSYGAAVETPGFLKMEIWSGLSTSDNSLDTTLLADPRYPATPDIVSYTTGLDSRPVYPDDSHEGYGAKISGWLTPTETADYDFFLRSDDSSRFFISTDATESNLVMVAEQTGCCNAFTEPGVAYTTATPIHLIAGTKYAVQILYKEGTGGDYGQVAWRKKGDTTPAASLKPVTGDVLSSLADPANASVTITNQPANVTVAENKPVTFTVAASFTTPFKVYPGTFNPFYQWYKNGTPIAGANSSSYSIPFVKIADNGTKFKCLVAVPGVPVNSSEATLTVNADTTPPTVLSVSADSTFVSVVVKYSEPVTDSALTAANYTIDQGVTVKSVARVDSQTVNITPTSALPQGKTLTLTINGVQDTATPANTIAANTTAKFTSFSLVTGIFVWQLYDGDGFTAGSGSLTDLEGRWQSLTPTRTLVFTSSDTPAWEYGDNYGSVAQGQIIAPETGDYIFHIASDDQSQLFLSTDSTPAKLGTDPICQITTWDNHTDWAGAAGGPDTNPQTGNLSNPITLTKGNQYFFRVFQVEGGGGDGVSIGWERPSNAGTIEVIPGANLATAVNGGNSVVSITLQPKSVTGVDGKTVTFSVAATGSSDVGNTILYQWQKNGVDIAGATSAKYTTPLLTLADNQATFDCMVSVPAKSVKSDVATLTVVADTFPPVVAGVGAVKNQAGTFDIGVQFDEDVTAATAKATANYTLSAGAISAVNLMTNSPGVIITASGLTAGTKYTLTVKNVADLKNNAITSTNVDFTVGNMSWGAVGNDTSSGSLALGFPAGNAVLAVGTNGFDMYSDGIGEWNNYDEATFVYEQITGDFDKVLRVEYQDNSSQWARAGLVARDVTNFGVDAVAQTGDPTGASSNSGTPPYAGNAGRYQKVHVNPVGPTLTGPGNAGNANWEGNRRLDTGGPSSSVMSGNGAVPQYPNAWVRLQRAGQQFTIYRSEDGKFWRIMGSANWTLGEAKDTTVATTGAMPNTLFVGPEFSPENGNITTDTDRGRWVAKIREYGDYQGLVSKDTVSQRKVFPTGGTKFTANGGGHSGKTGDYAMDLGDGTLEGGLHVPDATFVNAAASNDTMSVSLWVKQYNVANSSAFWFNSPTSPSEARGFQAHVPWGDNTVYFDTAGCCTAGETRINASITTFADYTGTDWWTNKWHNFVFVKDGADKNIYIDGKLFLNGQGSTPLPTDFTEIFLGGSGYGYDNPYHGLIDDFAVFGSGLTAANATALASGTSPKDLGASAKLLAFWDFNDAPAIAVGPTLTWARTTGGGLTITYTGTLQSVDTITGSWAPVAGATSPYTVTPSKTAQFFRASQ